MCEPILNMDSVLKGATQKRGAGHEQASRETLPAALGIRRWEGGSNRRTIHFGAHFVSCRRFLFCRLMEWNQQVKENVMTRPMKK